MLSLCSTEIGQYYIPPAEKPYLDDRVLHKGVGSHELVVGGVVDHSQNTGFAGAHCESNVERLDLRILRSGFVLQVFACFHIHSEQTTSRTSRS